VLEIPKVIVLIALIIVGLNLAANNTLVSILVSYVFYKDKSSGLVIRLCGIVMALSTLLVIFDMTDIATSINIIILLVFAFFSIRGRNKAYAEKMNARDRLLKEYQEEIKRKREKVQALKSKALNKDKDKPFGVEGQSVEDIKKKMWNDGSMTNKELINGFGDKDKS